MNSFKTLFVVAILAAVAYGVYVSINSNPGAPPQTEAPQGWTSNPPKISLPGIGSRTPGFPLDSSGSDNRLGNLGSTSGQSGPRGGSMVPPFEPTSPSTSSAGGSLAAGYGSHRAADNRHVPPDIDHPSFDSRSLDTARSRLTMPSDTMPGSEALQPGSESAPRDEGEVRPEFSDFLEAARDDLDKGHLAEVHQRLSAWYGDSRLSTEESHQLTALLDQVAGSVIYSTEPVLGPLYQVKPGETLEQIGEAYEVPWQLLAKINGIRDPRDLTPGQGLKVVRGPFEVVIDLDKYELTVKLDGRYAGRFPIGIGRDHENLEGTYTVGDKSINPTYYGRDRIIDADDSNNPYGERWIGLGNQVGIHGTNDSRNVLSSEGRGSICLDDRDIEDVYDILSIGSRIVIRR